LVGAITAFSSEGIAVSEKVWYPLKNDTAKYTYFGKPWTYVLRDLVQFGHNLEDTIEALEDTKRTMKLHIGIGSESDNQFRGIEYASNKITVFDDTNYTYYTPSHPQLEGVMFWDKHVQPSGDSCVGEILQSSHKQITMETLYRNVTAFH